MDIIIAMARLHECSVRGPEVGDNTHWEVKLGQVLGLPRIGLELTSL